MSDSAMHLHLILTFKSRPLLWWKLLCDGVVMLMGGREQLLVYIKRKFFFHKANGCYKANGHYIATE